MHVYSDSSFLTTVLQNLLDNAIKYRLRNDGHEVSVSASASGTRGVTILVSDNGEGISVSMQERIFEMFFRGSLKSSGSGLGLYIVKKAIDLLEGSISVESRPGEATCFKVFIPNFAAGLQNLP